MSLIQMDGVEKSYHVRGQLVQALASSKLQVEAKELLVIRGPSGAGKTTLLTILGGMLTPSAGSLRISGQDLLAMSAAQRAAFRSTHVGFVFQSMHLLPYLSLLENVKLGGGSEINALTLLEELGLSHRLAHRPAQLSVGERQRGALARALVHAPKIVLADEPTGNLDPDNAEQVIQTLDRFRRQGGAVIMATHSACQPVDARFFTLGQDGLQECPSQAPLQS
ncbi:MAG: ABC transporter ATP-binding protein [Planctomycetes bacterium]|nr:ABC transporter ATP-binding protein [Planctomycetota bacterium]MCP4770489.1 ABC transporter ATP-binding protein [Planctomycetota bacterium]MCP4859929.1 ABC transporter ATP-binding protein [Planctomycetota bacterium]